MSAPGTADGGDGVRIPGVAVGVVEDNEDPEGLGRVKVHLQWRAAEDQTFWASIAVPMAGNDMGTYFLPEEGDQVLIAFDKGDIDHPYVIGALWNKQDAPPADNGDGNNDVRMIRSRSGHEIVFDDADDGGGIEITTNGGHTVSLDDAEGTVSVADSGGNEVVLDGNGGSIEVTAASSLTISAPSVEIAADGSMKIESSGVLELKGSIINLN